MRRLLLGRTELSDSEAQLVALHRVRAGRQLAIEFTRTPASGAAEPDAAQNQAAGSGHHTRPRQLPPANAWRSSASLLRHLSPSDHVVGVALPTRAAAIPRAMIGVGHRAAVATCSCRSEPSRKLRRAASRPVEPPASRENPFRAARDRAGSPAPCRRADILGRCVGSQRGTTPRSATWSVSSSDPSASGAAMWHPGCAAADWNLRASSTSSDARLLRSSPRSMWPCSPRRTKPDMGLNDQSRPRGFPSRRVRDALSPAEPHSGGDWGTRG